MCPVYQTECAKAHVRGKLVVLLSLCSAATFCLSNWMNYGLRHSTGSFQWRFPLAFQLVFAIFTFPVFPFIPESPRWLLLRDRQQDALMSNSRLAGHDIDMYDDEVSAQVSFIKAAIREERENRARVRDVLLCRDGEQNLRRLLLGCGTQVMRQFSGVSALGMKPPVSLLQCLCRFLRAVTV